MAIPLGECCLKQKWLNRCHIGSNARRFWYLQRRLPIDLIWSLRKINKKFLKCLRKRVFRLAFIYRFLFLSEENVWQTIHSKIISNLIETNFHTICVTFNGKERNVFLRCLSSKLFGNYFLFKNKKNFKSFEEKSFNSFPFVLFIILSFCGKSFASNWKLIFLLNVKKGFLKMNFQTNNYLSECLKSIITSKGKDLSFIDSICMLREIIKKFQMIYEF